MSSGFKTNGTDLSNYFQPYFASAGLSQLSGFKINGVQAFARRDNDPNNAPSITSYLNVANQISKTWKYLDYIRTFYPNSNTFLLAFTKVCQKKKLQKLLTR